MAVLNPDKSHVLLGQRSSTAPIFAKKWTLPGGHLDHVDAESPLILSDSLQSIFQNIVPKPSGLTLQQALNAGLRELKEETGYDLTSDVQAISTAKLLGWAEIDGRAGDKIVTFYFSLIGETQRELNIVSHEYSQLQWLDRAAILENDLAPKSKGACIRALSHPNQHNEHEI
ncbi:MAG: NUDIX hydrolase [Pseudomonadota bacterium]